MMVRAALLSLLLAVGVTAPAPAQPVNYSPPPAGQAYPILEPIPTP